MALLTLTQILHDHHFGTQLTTSHQDVPIIAPTGPHLQDRAGDLSRLVRDGRGRHHVLQRLRHRLRLGLRAEERRCLGPGEPSRAPPDQSRTRHPESPFRRRRQQQQRRRPVGMEPGLPTGRAAPLGAQADGAGKAGPPRRDGEACEDTAGSRGTHEGEVQAQPIQFTGLGFHQPESISPRRQIGRVQK